MKRILKVKSIVKVPALSNRIGKVLDVLKTSTFEEVYVVEILGFGTVLASRDELRLVEDPHFTPVKTVYDKPKTIMYFADGTSETVVCQEGDRYSKLTGTLLCSFKRTLGNDKYDEAVLKTFEQYNANKGH